MKLTKWMAAAALFLSFGVAGCTDDITDEVSQLTRNTDEVSVAYNKDATARISVRVPGAWSASVACKDAAGQETAAWLRLDPAEGVGNGKDYQWITAIADRNLGGEREAVITIVGATRGDAVEVKVTQDDGTFTVKKPVLSGDLKANVVSNALLAVEYDKAKGGEPVEITFTFDGDDRGLAIKDYTGTIEGEGSGKIELPITGTPSDIGVVKLNMKMTIEGKTIFDDVISLNIQSENFIFSMDFGKFVWGGDLMAAAGGEANLAKHYRETSFFGIVQVLKNLRTIKRQMRECRADVAAFAPDVLILVDYPGFNMKMARWAKEHGIRTFYYIAPKVWAWREWRVKAIRRWVDRLFVIFPFECGYFPRHGVEPIFEGNPLVDAIEARRTSLPSPDEFRRRHGLDRRPIIALLAGSRRGEIRDNLPLMADLSRKFPDHQFVVAGVAWLDRALYEQYMAGSDIRYVCDQTYETLAAAEAAVVTSGTATLETALLGIPEVVVYRTLWFQVKLRPYVLKVPWVSLVNLNLGREAVAEVIQSDLDTTRAERELRAIVAGGEKRGRMLADFAELRTVIGGPGASDRFAARMVAELRAPETK